ncbi:MAG TPA: BMC domain-containing protein [Candidatus Saccharimonadales bacterium]|nr:BMC domain-containing protein [Candidatus Saccharimonadales bacterium]
MSERPAAAPAPALGALETTSVARGHHAGDEMVKAAHVRLLRAEALSPGKYWVVVSGTVADVESSLRMGLRAAGETLIDSLFIPNLHPGVLPALTGTAPPPPQAALGIVETASAAAGVRAADRALKTAPVELHELRLANGLGGKAYFTLSGSVSDVNAAVEAAEREAAASQQFVASQVLPRPHRDFLAGAVGR